MGKKKSNSRAKRKEENLKAASQNADSVKAQNNTSNSNKTDNDKKTGGYQPQPAPKLTAYTVVAMLASLIAAGATALAMVVLAKPVYYAAEAYFGDSLDSVYFDMMAQLMADNEYDKLFIGLLSGAAVALAIAAIISLVGVVKAINPDNKPAVIMSVVSFVLAGIAIGLYIGATIYMNDKMGQIGFEKQSVFSLYTGYFAALIANAVILLCNIFAALSGKSRWKKDGKTF